MATLEAISKKFNKIQGNPGEIFQRQRGHECSAKEAVEVLLGVSRGEALYSWGDYIIYCEHAFARMVHTQQPSSLSVWKLDSEGRRLKLENRPLLPALNWDAASKLGDIELKPFLQGCRVIGFSNPKTPFSFVLCGVWAQFLCGDDGEYGSFNKECGKTSFYPIRLDPSLVKRAFKGIKGGMCRVYRSFNTACFEMEDRTVIILPLLK